MAIFGVIFGRVFITGMALFATQQASATTPPPPVAAPTEHALPQEQNASSLASLTNLVDQLQAGQEQLIAGQSALAIALTYLKSIHYDTDTACTIELPNTGISCTATWGFAASGDCFLPLTPCTISMTSTTKGQAPTFENLAICLAKTKALATAQEATGLVNAIKNLSDNPLSLLVIKIGLLLKDHANNRAYVKQELMRLLLRLSITKLPTMTANSTPLSQRLPANITTWLTDTMPDALEFLDASWQAITHNEARELPAVYVQALVFIDGELAKKVAQEFQYATTAQAIQEAISSRGIMALDLADLQLAGKRTPTVAIPATAKNLAINVCSLVTDAAQLPATAKASTTPGITLVSTDNLHWVIVATDQLSTAQSATALTTTLITSLKRFIAARALYLKNHPEAALARQAADKARKEQAHFITAFTTTALGTATKTSLTQKLQAATTAYRPAAPVVLSKKDLDEKTAQLAVLRAQVKTFAERQQPVPAAVTEAITALEAALPRNPEQADYAPVALSYAVLGGCLAGLHEKAAQELHKTIADQELALTARLKRITSATQRLIEETSFKLNIVDPGTAYAEHLTTQAKLMRERCAQIKELANIRALAANGTLDGSATDTMQTYGLLEVTVGSILDARTPADFAAELVKEPSLFASFKQDIVSGDPAYAQINTETLDALALIFKRSPQLRVTHNEVLSQALALFAPTAVPVYKRALAASQAVV